MWIVENIFMVKVKLFFETFTDSEMSNHTIIRLKCGVQFRKKNGWTQPYSAIIDTGAHTSVIPLSLWKELSYVPKGKHKIFGLSKKEECSLVGELAEIALIFVDEEGIQTTELNARAFLADTDQIPIILGFNGILEQLHVTFEYTKNTAYVEDEH